MEDTFSCTASLVRFNLLFGTVIKNQHIDGARPIGIKKWCKGRVPHCWDNSIRSNDVVLLLTQNYENIIFSELMWLWLYKWELCVHFYWTLLYCVSNNPNTGIKSGHRLQDWSSWIRSTFGIEVRQLQFSQLNSIGSSCLIASIFFTCMCVAAVHLFTGEISLKYFN